MSCSDYNDFYSLLASNTLILISIFIALGTILWQNRSIDQKEIEKRIQDLTRSITTFIELTPIKDRDPSRKKEDIIADVRKNYDNWKQEKGTRQSFLQYLDALQGKIHLDFIGKLDKYDINKRYTINIDKYEQFMDEIYPYLNEVENMRNSNIDIIQETKISDGVYEDYWKKLTDIRKLAIEIDKDMYTYNFTRSGFNSIFDSSASKFWIGSSLIILSFYDIVIPFYMIQPNHIGILPCRIVFIFTILSLITCPICIYLAYSSRCKYPVRFENPNKEV